jgi:HD-like signal output (HDOD) protein
MAKDREHPIRRRFDESHALPTLLRMTHQVEVDLRAIAREVQRIPELTDGVIRIANSARFPRKNNITSIDHAVAILGQQRL